VITKLGRGGEAVANEMGKEVATLATRLADRLRAAANRADEQPGAPEHPEEEHAESEHKDDEHKP
jgi:hypothetical protein